MPERYQIKSDDVNKVILSAEPQSFLDNPAMPRRSNPKRYTAFGHRLDEARVARGDVYPSQADLARALKVSPQRYSSWLVGKGHPDHGMLATICRLLELDMNFLISGNSTIVQMTNRTRRTRP